MQFLGKLMNQTWKNDKKTWFWARFWTVWPIFGSQNFFADFTSTSSLQESYAIYRKTNETNLRKWQKKKILGLILACFRPNLVPKIFFRGFNLNYMLYIVVSYHCMQFQGKLMNQTSKNGKKTSFGHNFGTFGPNLGPKNFFHGLYLYYILGTIACYHCIQFQGKQMNETCENGWKPSLGPILVHVSPNLTLKNFLWVLHLLDVMHCSKLS